MVLVIADESLDLQPVVAQARAWLDQVWNFRYRAQFILEVGIDLLAWSALIGLNIA